MYGRCPHCHEFDGYPLMKCKISWFFTWFLMFFGNFMWFSLFFYCFAVVCPRSEFYHILSTLISRTSHNTFFIISQLEKPAKHSSNRRLWAALNVSLRGMLIGFGDIERHFSKSCTETCKKMYTIQNDEDHVSKKWRTVFLTIGTVYLKYTT